MRYAIFSDIHNDASTLATILHHTRAHQVDGYFCLGDVGVDNCIDLVRQVEAPTVFGNWEVSGWRYLSSDNQEWALNLPAIRKTENFWLTHAAPLWPKHLTKLADLKDKRQMMPTFRLFPYLHFESEALWKTFAALSEANVSLLFHGHTHRQIVWRFTVNNYLQKLTHRTIALRPGDTLVVGVGSVGRPEDGPSAAYVIYDDKMQQIEMMRVKAIQQRR